MRRLVPSALVVLAGVLLLAGGLALWLRVAAYDSDGFARRTTSVLDSSAVRQEAAERLTQELVLAGNRDAISYRPAVEVGIAAALDTDTLRAIVRDAVREAHAALVRGGSGSGGLDLSDSIAIVGASLQLPEAADESTPVAPGSLGASFTEVTRWLAHLHLLRLAEAVDAIAAGCLALALAAAAAAVAWSRNRRRTLWWLGWAVAGAGLAALALRAAAGWLLARELGDPVLGRAVEDGFERMTADLGTLGRWTIAYGVVLAGAAATAERAYTPGAMLRRARAWVDRRRATSGGTALVGALGLLAGVAVVGRTDAVTTAAVAALGLWLTYAGMVELVALVRRVSSERARGAWWQPAIAGGVTLAVLVVAATALLAATERSAARAAAVAPAGCNGDQALCDLRLDQVMFPGTHNSMSSPLYPGWLFGEQVGTIGDQLRGGVRALLFDTHYGVPSTLRLPGSPEPVVLTDRARELTHPGFEQPDPELAERAATLGRDAPRAVGARSSIYLCHNFCELGAVPFAEALSELRDFVESHPTDVVLVVIQDATGAADTAQAFVDAGLEPHLARLSLDRPPPTLRELIDAGTNLVVFAEAGGPGAPAWYQPAYEGWMQETPYDFASTADFDCAPNRGGTVGRLFLVNHWVSGGRPDPDRARSANADAVLGARLDRCLAERGRLPNIVAVDFAQASDVVPLLARVNGPLLERAEQAAPAGR